MKKVFTLIGFMAAMISAMATTFTFPSADATKQTKEGITVILDKGSGNNEPFFSNSGEMRLYAGNTVTVSGSDLTDIKMTFAKQGSKEYAALSASTGNLMSGGTSTSSTDLKTDAWTGSANEVTFTLGASGQRIIAELVVNDNGSGQNPGGNGDDDDNPGIEPGTRSVTITPPAQSVSGDAYYFTDGGVTVSCTQGAITNKYFSVYAGYDLTVSAGAEIKSIVVNGFIKKEFTATVDNGKISYKDASGGDLEADEIVVITDINSKSVTISCVKQMRCYSVVVNFVDNPGGSEGEDPVDPDPDTDYDEPTVISVPSMTVQGEAYSFKTNNISVSCTRGAVTADYFSAHAGFAMTFSANQPIKGIVINGFVKKEFSATVDHGTIEYISPSMDVTASPVVVVKDVNSKSVTISCVKQLRCYTVEVYFENNPEATVGGGGSASGEKFVYDTADAVYEKEYSDMIGEDNYSIFLYNQSDFVTYVALDIYPGNNESLAGTYRMNDYSLGDYTYYVYGENEDDITFAYDGQATITQNGDVFTITGYMVCDNGKTYEFSFEGELPVYLDSDYYYGGDDGDDDGDEDLDAVDNIAVDNDNIPARLDPNAPMYDLQGRRVAGAYRGIVIQNGAKFNLR